MAFRLISLILSLSLFCQQAGIAYASGELNLANYLSSMRNAVVQADVFQPARLRYISYDINNNDFKLLLDKGDAKLNDSTRELFNYFLIGLALPNDTFWVNLRPDAPENIIDPILEKTDIGKIFLEADLQLKKDTASLTSPQNPEGRQYWDKLYKKAGELFGSENITIPTITRPWIVPNEVIVRETEDSAYIYKATLKVMLEEDYLRGMKDDPAVGGASGRGTIDYSFNDPRLKELNEYSTQLIRETIIPKLTKEINSSKRYAKLRQVYYSLVLSRWFKHKYSSPGSVRASEHPSTTLGASQNAGASANSYLSLIDSGNLANLASPEPCDKQTYFQAYQKSFKDGEYNLKETVTSPSSQSIRSYISGGIGINVVSSPAAVKVGYDNLAVAPELTSGLVIVSSSLEKDDRPIDARLIEICRRYKQYSLGYRLEDAAQDIIEIFKNGNPKFKYTMDIQAVGILKDYIAKMKVSGKELDALDEAIANKVIEILGKLKIGEDGTPVQEWVLIDELLGDIEKIKKNPHKPEWIEKILKGFDPFIEIANSRMSEFLNKLKERIVYGSFDPKDVMIRWNGVCKEIGVNLAIPASKKGKIEAAMKEITDLIEEQIKLFYGDDINLIHKQQTSGSPLTEEDFKGYLKSIKGHLDGIGRDVSSLPEVVKKSVDDYCFRGMVAVNKLQNMLKPLTQVNSVLSVLAVLKENLNEMSSAARRSLLTENLEEDVQVNLRSIPLAVATAVLPSVRRLEKELQNISASPIATYETGELVFWNGDEPDIARKAKETIFKYVQGNKLKDEQFKAAALWLRGYVKTGGFWESKIISLERVIGVIEKRDKKMLSNLRFAFSENGDFGGCVEILDKKDDGGNLNPEVNFVTGMNQWIEIALTVAAIQELADNMQAEGDYIVLNNIRRDNPYVNIVLNQFIDGGLSDISSELDRGRSWTVLFKRNIPTIINKFYQDVQEKINSNNNLLKLIMETSSPLTTHILSYEERSKIIGIKKELSILTVEVSHLLNAYPDLLKKGHYREVPKKIKEFDSQNDILSLAGIMKEFYSAVSRQDAKENYGNKIADKIKEWAEVQDIVNKAIEIINKSIDDDIELEHNQLTEVPPGYGGEMKDYWDDVKMLLEKKDFAGVASWMILWCGWQGKEDRVREWREISEELKIINMRSGLPHYFSSSALKRGGIDLTDRMMRLKIERVGGFVDLKLFLPEVQNAQGLDLDKEFRQIEAIASSGIVPNSRRILELFSACYSRGEFGQRLPQVISCLKASSAIQEKLAIDSDDDFRLCLLLPEIFSDGG